MKRVAAASVLALACLAPAVASAAAARTVVSHEEEKYFYEGGRMQRFEGQFEHTYHLDPERGIVTRTRLYDYRTKRITPDDTVYAIQKELRSDPSQSQRYALAPVVRAVGRPDEDHVEVLTINDREVVSAVAAPGRLVVSRARRLR